jgi:hypothetical protein
MIIPLSNQSIICCEQVLKSKTHANKYQKFMTDQMTTMKLFSPAVEEMAPLKFTYEREHGSDGESTY